MPFFKPRLSAVAAIGAVALTAAVSGPAKADQTIQNATDYARVIDVVPIAPPQSAREVCRPEPGAYRGTPGSTTRSNTGAVLGGLGGALVGSRFGDGNGRVAATVAGAIGGAILGDRYDNNDRDRYEQAPVRRCETVYEPTGPTRYQVSYDYQGQRGTVVMNRDPGEWLRVHKTITIEQ